MSGVVNLPQYIIQADFERQQPYFELLSLILTQWFNSNGFFQPTLTNAQVTTLMAMTPPLPNGTHWLNSDANKMQFVDATGTVQTITST